MDRPELERRCAFMDHRLTVLFAPGGFGKTALLAHCCAGQRQRGVGVAWLSLDEQDGPGTLATYLLAAFEEAGLAVFDEYGVGPAADPSNAPGREMDDEAAYRVSVLVAAIERSGAPWLLALDEAERVDGQHAVRTLNVLLERAPRSLHFAMAFRERPTGLDIGTIQLEAANVRLSAEDLRFSEPEVARFFRMQLSSRERRAIVEQSAGWPLALRIFRNARDKGQTPAAGEDTVAAWIETRLWRGLAAEDRELVLDMSLFEWFDGELMDEALAEAGTAERIASMRSLAGLVETANADRPKMRLHPLIRDYGAERRMRETPDRFRAIHAGIARSLASRGQVVEALRHAAAAGDLDLTGRIAERTCSLTAGAHVGLAVGRKALGMLRDEAFRAFPRLALTRCLLLAMDGHMNEAEETYRSVSEATAAFSNDRPDGDEEALALEHALLLGAMYVSGCRFRGITEVAGVERVADLWASDIDPRIRAVFAYGICATNGKLAKFDEAVDWAVRAQIGERSHLAPRVRYELGITAMAKGRVAEARKHYEEGLALSRSFHLRDSGVVVIGDVLKDELAFEQGGGTAELKSLGVSPRLLGESFAAASVFQASLGMGVQWALCRDDSDGATALVELAREYALRTGRRWLAKYATALHVAVLLADHRVVEAARVWRFEELPATPEDCLDLRRRGWRQTELLASSRIRLCVASGDFSKGRELAAGLCQLAAARNLRRTEMRGEALAMLVEHSAGDVDAAMRHLAAFLGHYAETGYAAGLAANGDAAIDLLDRFVEEQESASAQDLATFLRRGGQSEAVADSEPTLTPAEAAVLGRVARGEPDKRIAAGLKLSVYGVRYRFRTIFSKLGVSTRYEAVHRARELGIRLGE